MSDRKHVFIGFGDIAKRCAKRLCAQGDHVVGIARSEKEVNENLEYWRGDITSSQILERMDSEAFYSAVITLTPSEYSKEGYRKAYLEPVIKLVERWKNNGKAPSKILFVSSTSVFAQSKGEWVSEASPAAPIAPNAKVLREAEITLEKSGLNVCVIRFSGIYGPERDFLIRQVVAGKGGSEDWTNRIHIDDCCGVICHVLELPAENFPSLILASDEEPVQSRDVRTWIAEQLDIGLDSLLPSVSNRGGSKRCDNKGLLSTGYKFIYPNYRDGYQTALDVFRNKKKGSL